MKVHALMALSIDVQVEEEATLWAEELNSGSYDYAHDICDFRIGVPARGQGQKVAPDTDHWVFTCNDLAKYGQVIPVDLWAMNCAGEWSYTATYVVLEDLRAACKVSHLAKAEKEEKQSSEKNTPPFILTKDPSFQLFQNQPNPFREETSIGFLLTDNMQVTLRIYDAMGRTLKVVERPFDKGYHEIHIRREELHGGSLFYSLRTPAGIQIRKMLTISP
ncbi:MAG TPA: hypothetical protein ENJ45_02175 [Phaeodactylibacter sp.]|nr:hypothetical protein [Phaeodactylibacter sp.]